MPPEDFCTTKVFLDDQPFETLHTNLCLSDHSFKVSRMESKEGEELGQTSVRILSKKRIRLQLSGIKMSYSFNYKVWTEPGYKWINRSDKGEIDFQFNGLDLVIQLQKTKSSSFDVFLLDVEILDVKYNVHLGGNENNLMKSIANTMNRFKPIIE